MRNCRPLGFSQFNGAEWLALTPFCLRLGDCITATSPKLDIELLGYCIFKKDFHLLNYATHTVAPHSDRKARRNPEPTIARFGHVGPTVDVDMAEAAALEVRRA